VGGKEKEHSMEQGRKGSPPIPRILIREGRTPFPTKGKEGGERSSKSRTRARSRDNLERKNAFRQKEPVPAMPSGKSEKRIASP